MSLNIENTLWANTVIASGTAIGIVIYTGPETRSMMNNNEPRSKVGLLDYEVNSITKVLFAAVVILAFAMICLKGLLNQLNCFLINCFLFKLKALTDRIIDIGFDSYYYFHI